MKEGACECCGETTLLRPNRRPHMPLLSDDDLLKMVDHHGEEAATTYQVAMTTFMDTWECANCRILGSYEYFIIRAMKDSKQCARSSYLSPICLS